MALGASRGDLLRFVLRRGLGLAFAGIVGGYLMSFYASRLVTEFLFKVEPLDPAVLCAVTLVLILVSIVSTLVPALRAAWTEPIRCLRRE